MSATSETGGEVPKPAEATMADYRDYSRATEESVAAEAVNAAADQKHQTSVVSDQNFPVKLHYVLHELEDDGLSHIVSWSPHGRSFIVHKHDLFVQTILCRYVVLFAVAAIMTCSAEVAYPNTIRSVLSAGFGKQSSHRFSASSTSMVFLASRPVRLPRALSTLLFLPRCTWLTTTVTCILL
jgi:HSF-type DNA-binding